MYGATGGIVSGITVAGLDSIVPVVWKPSPDFNVGRSGKQPIAIVHHRAVASKLTGIDATLISSTRQVSAQFAIGHVDGKLEIHQYVDVSDTAWCNGDCQQDTYPTEPSNWDNWFGHTLHNARTVSIEHEDQGGSTDATKKGIVTEDIIKASIALDKLLISGNITAIRTAGIHVRDADTVTALHAMPIDAKHLITHHDIAGKLKPSCWLPWSADKVGFPRARYVKELTPVVAPTYTQAQLDAAKSAAYDTGFAAGVASVPASDTTAAFNNGVTAASVAALTAKQ